MACGCSKRRSSSGSTPNPKAQSAAPKTPSTKTPRATTTARTTSFVLQMKTGLRQSFPTKLEAEAARVRFGGDGTIRER